MQTVNTSKSSRKVYMYSLYNSSNFSVGFKLFLRFLKRPLTFKATRPLLSARRGLRPACAGYGKASVSEGRVWPPGLHCWCSLCSRSPQPGRGCGGRGGRGVRGAGTSELGFYAPGLPRVSFVRRVQVPTAACSSLSGSLLPPSAPSFSRSVWPRSPSQPLCPCQLASGTPAMLRSPLAARPWPCGLGSGLMCPLFAYQRPHRWAGFRPSAHSSFLL